MFLDQGGAQNEILACKSDVFGFLAFCHFWVFCVLCVFWVCFGVFWCVPNAQHIFGIYVVLACFWSFLGVFRVFLVVFVCFYIHM